MEKKDKLSYASPKSKLNGIDQQMSALSMMGTGTGTGFGTGTGSGSGVETEERISGTETKRLSFSKDDITWDGSINVFYVGVLKRKNGIITGGYIDSCSYTYSFKGCKREENNGNGRVEIEGLDVAGSISSGTLESITFTIQTSTYVSSPAGEELSSVSTSSTTATLSVSEATVNDWGMIEVTAELS